MEKISVLLISVPLMIVDARDRSALCKFFF